MPPKAKNHKKQSASSRKRNQLKNHTNLDTTPVSNLGIQITDLLGRVVYERKVPDGAQQYNKVISMRRQSDGVYFVRILQGNSIIGYRKVIKHY